MNSNRYVILLLGRMVMEYYKQNDYKNMDAKVGDWAVEQSSLVKVVYNVKRKYSIHLMKIEEMDYMGGYYGQGLNGKNIKWTNASFTRLPDNVQKMLNSILSQNVKDKKEE